MKNILIIGAHGQLGKALQSRYPEARAVDADKLDISDKEAVEAFDWNNIDTILNAAAYTNVDGAETDEGRVIAWKVNAEAVRNIAHVAWQHDLKVIHISTDYVFDGSKSPHLESESFSPLSVYGASKAAGDLLVAQLDKFYILRTSWVIGDGKNFVRTMLGLGQKGINPKVVSDQIGRLTFTNTLVDAISHLLQTNSKYGAYNISNDGEPASWADITRTIYEEAGLRNSVTDTTTSAYYQGKDNIAPRPLQSALSLDKIKSIGFEPKDWRTDLAEYIKKELST